jgi:dihydrofolate synthase/folylpolyglutamate synthase
LASLGDPQLAFASILIVGTNGKGSTAIMLEAILEAHGVTTGLTTSPHLVAVEERIRVGGRPVDRETLSRHLGRVAPFEDLTFFEALTATAFLAFAEAPVDVAILEAGMGGTWDATRAADSVLAGITNIGSDHSRWLGESMSDRARDKGAALAAARRGVIGPGVSQSLVSALGAPEAMAAAELVEVTRTTSGDVRVSWDDHVLEIPVPLNGAHQVANLHLALGLARGAELDGLAPALDPLAVARGLQRVQWPGRLTEHRISARKVLLDGAHNPEGARALASHLEGDPTRRNLLFSCLEDKEVGAMASALEPVVGEIVVCPLNDDRAMPVERIAAAFSRARPVDDISTALEILPDPVVAAGSLRLVGALLEMAEKGAGS